MTALIMAFVVVAAAMTSAAMTAPVLESALVRYIRETDGGYVGSVSIETHGGRRGLFTNAAVKAGDVLVAVPKECLTFAEEADLRPEWGLTLGEFLAANLAGAKSREESTPYLDALPEAELLLSDWKQEEVTQLQSPRLQVDIDGLRAHTAKMLLKIEPWVPAASSATIDWSERMVRSRALTFESGWKGSLLMCMVPLIDMANHRTPQQSEVACFPVDLDRTIGAERVVLRAPMDLEQGAEVYITYGYNGNDHLLLDYGFAEAPRAGQLGSESLWLDADRALEVVLAVEDLGLEKTVGGLARRVMRDAASSAEGTAAASPKAASEAMSLDDVSSAVRGALVLACAAALKRMPTTLSADEEELRNPGEGAFSPRRHAALTYRVAQKQYLARSIELLRGMGDCAPASEDSSLLDPLKRE